MNNRAWVRRQFNDYRDALYKIDDIDGLHWGDVSGGINQRSPRAFLMGYVWCDGMLEGELAHSCAHGRGPHKIKICILKKNNSPEVFVELSVRAEAEFAVQRTRAQRGLTRQQADELRLAVSSEVKALLSNLTPIRQLAELTRRASRAFALRKLDKAG